MSWKRLAGLSANDLLLVCKSGKEAVSELTQNRNGDNPLIISARMGREDLVEVLLDQEMFPVNAINKEDKTALHEAAQQSHLVIVRQLLERGASVTALKRGDWTPLMTACAKDSIEVVSTLLEANSDPCFRDRLGWNSFHVAARGGQAGIIEVLLKSSPMCWKTKAKNGKTPIHTAAAHGRLECLKVMQTSCAYPTNEPDLLGATPLMDSLKGNHVECAQLLINMGANVDVKDRFGHDLLHISAESGALQSMRFLVDECHMTPIPAGRSSATPLHLAATNGALDAVKYLVKHFPGIVSMKDFQGNTALDFAQFKGHKECVRILTAAGEAVS